MFDIDVSSLNKAESIVKIITVMVTCSAAAAGLLFTIRGREDSKSASNILNNPGSWSKADKDRLKAILAFRNRVIVSMLIFCTMSAIAAIGLYLNSSTDSTALARYLERHDGTVFSHGKTYEVARIFVSRDDLVSGTKIKEDLERIDRTFDFLANSANVLRNNIESIRDAVKRGAHVRIILSDPGLENAANLDAFQKAVGQNTTEARGQINNVVRLLLQLQREKRQDVSGVYKGDILIAFNTRPLLYTMWITNRNSPDAVGHLGVHFYRGYENWPSFRFSKEGKRMIGNMSAEFNSAWMHAKEVNIENYKGWNGLDFQTLD